MNLQTVSAQTPAPVEEVVEQVESPLDFAKMNLQNLLAQAFAPVQHWVERAESQLDFAHRPVSYTHLTLPTIYSV